MKTCIALFAFVFASFAHASTAAPERVPASLLTSGTVAISHIFEEPAFAQTAVAPTPTPTGAPVVAAPAASTSGFFSSVWNFVNGPGGAYLFAALFAIDQLLAMAFPGLAANSVFQLFTVGLQKAEAKNPAPPASSA